jgi:hypothetical protein
MPHLFQGTKRCQRFTTGLAIAAFLTFPAHMVGQERVDPMATTVGQSFTMIEQSFIALADAMPAASYGFKPTDGAFKDARTFGEQVKHVACSNFAFFNEIEKKEPPRSIPEILAQAFHDQGYLDLQKRSSMGASRQRSGEALAWARRNAARGRRSWPSPIVRGSRSPSTSRAPRRTKSHWYTPHSRSGLSVSSRCVSSATTPTSRQTGCGTGARWRGTDRATPEDPETADARRSPATSLPTAVEGRATLCLVGNFRRIVVRYERFAENFLGMLYLASCLILLRGL